MRNHSTYSSFTIATLLAYRTLINFSQGFAKTDDIVATVESSPTNPAVTLDYSSFFAERQCVLIYEFARKEPLSMMNGKLPKELIPFKASPFDLEIPCIY